MQQEQKTFTGKTCSVTVIEDSVSQIGRTRLCTLQLRYPRYIHAEFMTHRAFSRNASSSRAIPTAKAIEMVREFPAFFAHVGKNQPGMQAHEEVSEHHKQQFANEWRALAKVVADYAERWSGEYGIHK